MLQVNFAPWSISLVWEDRIFSQILAWSFLHISSLVSYVGLNAGGTRSKGN
jgi:hypothetical protein